MAYGYSAKALAWLNPPTLSPNVAPGYYWICELSGSTRASLQAPSDAAKMQTLPPPVALEGSKPTVINA